MAQKLDAAVRKLVAVVEKLVAAVQKISRGVGKISDGGQNISRGVGQRIRCACWKDSRSGQKIVAAAVS